MKLSEMGRKKSNVVFTGKSLDRASGSSPSNANVETTVNVPQNAHKSTGKNDIPNAKGKKKDAWASLNSAFEGGEKKEDKQHQEETRQQAPKQRAPKGQRADDVPQKTKASVTANENPGPVQKSQEDRAPKGNDNRGRNDEETVKKSRARRTIENEPASKDSIQDKETYAPKPADKEDVNPEIPDHTQAAEQAGKGAPAYEAQVQNVPATGVFVNTEEPMEQHEHIVVPDELKDFLVIEDCSHFDSNVYMKTKTQEDILQSIVTARKIATMMKEKNGLSYPNTTLLYGPPGTGKTTLGRYVAYRMGMDFVYLDFSKIIDGIFGSTSRNISNIFQFMIDKECIFMLDELDAVAVKRGNESEATGGELGRITITIMQQFDYYRRHDSQAIIIAATNRADRIDAALRSRFSIEHEIKEMTVQEKVAYIENFLDRHDIPYNKDNIRKYSATNSLLPTRNVESDIIRCLVEYYRDDCEKPYILNHVAKKREF